MRLVLLNIKQSLRNLYKRRWQTGVSVLGLLLGVICLSFSLNWLWNELNRDAFRKDYRNLYKVQNAYFRDSLQAVSQGKITGNAAGIIGYSRYERFKQILPEGTVHSLIVPDRSGVLTDEEGEMLLFHQVSMVHPSYIVLADLKEVSGLLSGALRFPDRMIVSRSRARSWFGSEDEAIGKKVVYESKEPTEGRRSYVIEAVFEDETLPSNLHNEVLIACSEDVFASENARKYFDYGVLLRTDQPEALSYSMNQLLEVTPQVSIKPILNPLRKAHLSLTKPLANALFYPLAFTGLSILLLLSAVFNYLAVLTSTFLARVREYTLRLQLGGSLWQNILWLGTEVAFVVIFVLVLSGVLLESMTVLTDIPEMSIENYRGLFMAMLVLLILIGLGLLYPYYSLRKAYRTRHGGKHSLRSNNQILLGVQVAVCALLLFILINGYRQLHHLFTGDLGFTAENVLCIRTSGGSHEYAIFKDKFYTIESVLNQSSSPVVLRALAMSSDFFENTSGGYINAKQLGFDKGPAKDVFLQIMYVPYEMKEFFCLKIKEGEWFSPAAGNHPQVLINKEAVEALGLSATPRQFNMEHVPVPFEVRGMVDFRTQSLRNPQPPIMLFCKHFPKESSRFESSFDVVYVKYKPGCKLEAMKEIKRVMKDVGVPEYLIRIESMDNHILSFYKQERSYLKLFTLMTAGSMLITLFGVLSMMHYSLRVQRRNIAIRRVFGATYPTVCHQYLKVYLLCTLCGCVVAYPFSRYMMDIWLQTFAQNVSIGLEQGLGIWLTLSVSITLVVAWQVRTAMSESPAQVIKSE